jgi:hypothetical protein
MDTSMQHTYGSFDKSSSHDSAWKRFINWAKGQEENRLMWLALSIIVHGCVITMLTMVVIIFSGNHFIYWPFAIAAMGMSLVTNLAALPTKITIPVFFLSVLIDLIIIISCFINGFDASATYV